MLELIKKTGCTFLFLMLALPLVCIGGQQTMFDSCVSGQNIKHFDHLKKTRGEYPKYIDYQLIKRYPHDSSAFTQGLVFYKQNLYESTGLLDKSAVRKININNGKVMLKTDVSDIYFGEGLSLLDEQIVQMSWKSGKVFFFHPETLELITKMTFEKEVWGSTTINQQLIISNGSADIFFINPKDLTIKKVLKITLNGKELSGLNELEYADGFIYANVWPSHCIVKIDPEIGNVVGWLNLSKLYPDSAEHVLPDSAVLNGIAYDNQTHHFFVTGKFWPYLYEIKLQSNEY